MWIYFWSRVVSWFSSFYHCPHIRRILSMCRQTVPAFKRTSAISSEVRLARLPNQNHHKPVRWFCCLLSDRIRQQGLWLVLADNMHLECPSLRVIHCFQEAFSIPPRTSSSLWWRIRSFPNETEFSTPVTGVIWFFPNPPTDWAPTPLKEVCWTINTVWVELKPTLTP